MTRVNAAKLEFDRLCMMGERAGSVSEEAIDAAQAELGVVLPTQYREFLGEYGAAIMPGAEIYGLTDASSNDPPLWNDVRSVAKTLRDFPQSGAADIGFLPISEDGTGVYFFLNTHASPDTEIWAIGPDISQLVSESFYSFFVDLANRGGYSSPN